MENTQKVIKISLLNLKGGVGKTTTAINLATYLASVNRSVLLVDADMQRRAGSTSLVAAIDDVLPTPEKRRPTLTDVLREQASIVDAIRNVRNNFDMLPSDMNLDRANKYLISEGAAGLQRLREQLEMLSEVYDVFIVDHGPSFNSVSQSGLIAAPNLLVICGLNSLSVEGMLEMYDKLSTFGVELSIAGILPTMLNMSFELHPQYLADLQKNFGDRVLAPIRQDVRFDKSQNAHKTIFEYDPQSKGAHDITALGQELLARSESFV